jgi:NAD(P)-dependent dehydrogenase (short-subunit alcohol dehydrogenase family)
MNDRAPVALVTGAGTGIGRAIAERLAAGRYRVACIGRRAELLPAGHDFLPLCADVIRADQLNDAVAQIVATWGRVDAVVTAAGVMRAARLEALEAADIALQINTNLLGTLHTIRAALPHLKSVRGAVVTLSSTLSLRPIPGVCVYAATKGAVEALTRALAVELGPDLVRVNCIAPALVRSDIWLAAGVAPAAYDDLLARRGAAYPLGRVGEPADVAELAAFLLSHRASWLTGACVPADGGSSLGTR